jgi:hypothetical protein
MLGATMEEIMEVLKLWVVHPKWENRLRPETSFEPTTRWSAGRNIPFVPQNQRDYSTDFRSLRRLSFRESLPTPPTIY